ncbi:MAG TPA: hypothetical protein VH596_02030 [Terriglobales bacterium]
MLIDFESVWFKSYCRAVLDDEPETTRGYITDALQSINARLAAPGLSDEEREAMEAAQRYLLLIRNTDLRQAS